MPKNLRANTRTTAAPAASVASSPSEALNHETTPAHVPDTFILLLYGASRCTSAKFSGESGKDYKFLWVTARRQLIYLGREISADEFDKVAPDIFKADGFQNTARVVPIRVSHKPGEVAPVKPTPPPAAVPVAPEPPLNHETQEPAPEPVVEPVAAAPVTQIIADGATWDPDAN